MHPYIGSMLDQFFLPLKINYFWELRKIFGDVWYQTYLSTGLSFNSAKHSMFSGQTWILMLCGTYFMN